LIASAALAVSTAVVATVVSMGIARADLVGRMADGEIPAHHFWNTKNAPAAISAKPMAWFQASGSLR
jgi:hypothetical protein